MPKSIKSKSGRKALSNISNRPHLTNRRKTNVKEAQKNVTNVADASLDRLHAVHGSLARLINQIDGLVDRAHKANLANKLDACDLELFIEVLSRTHLTLQEWVPKFEQSFGHCSVTVKKQTVPSSPAASSSIAYDENLFPLDDFANSLPASPLVAWPLGIKGGCEKQLFLLTPMPKSRPTCSVSKVFPASEVIASVEKGESASKEAVIPQKMEAVTPRNTKKTLWKYTQSLEGKLPKFEKEDTLKILSTPGLEISPQKTCASPLVAWPLGTKGDCEKDLFLLTPMPKSRSTCSDSKVFPASEVIASIEKGESASKEAVIPQQMEAVTPWNTKKTLWKYSQSLEGKLPKFEKEDTLKILSTPGLEISPPKTCALLRPMSESSEKEGQDDSIQSTPPPTVRIPTFDDSPSEDLELQIPKSLRIKYPYLFKNEAEDSLPVTPAETSPRFTISPPKSCVLLLPSNEVLSDDVRQSHKVNERDKASPSSDYSPRFSVSENLTKPGQHEKTIEQKIPTKEGLKAKHPGSSADTFLYSTLSSKMMQSKGGKKQSPEPSETSSELGILHLDNNILSGVPRSPYNPDSALPSFAMPRSTQVSKNDTKKVSNSEKTSKQPGEETLRKELWSKLKAEYADRPSIEGYSGTSACAAARKDFTCKLDKASFEGNSFTNDASQISNLARPISSKDEGSSDYKSIALTRSTARVSLMESLSSAGDGSHKTGDVSMLDSMKRLQVGRLNRFLQNRSFGNTAERNAK